MRPITDDAGDTSVRLHHRFKASPPDVFRAWTTPAIITNWFAPGEMRVGRVSVDLRVGGRWEIEMVATDQTRYVVAGEFLQIVRPSKLSYSWLERGRPEEQRTTVTVEFRDHDGGTELILTQEPFCPEGRRDEHGRGWADVLGKLDRTLHQRS